jgi:FAD dependent oxidoreductase TIGR03364
VFAGVIRSRLTNSFDLAVIGAGILGLATALAAARQGLRVIVIDRDAQSNGASIRNFGFVTVSGQRQGEMWRRARRSREVWSEVARQAGIPIVHTGMWMTARFTESVAVLEAFLDTDMAEGCRMLTVAEARRRCPGLRAPDLQAVMESTLELRVESREAIPRLAAWLTSRHDVTFLRETVVHAIELPHIRTSNGDINATRAVVCPGDDFRTLYAPALQRFNLTRCKLQMLRLGDPGFRLPGALMSDLGLARYDGYARLAPAEQLKQRLRAQCRGQLAHGVHLIVVQSADGSLIVGDSHHYADTPDPFSHDRVDELILDEFRSALGIEPPAVIERWHGTYASASDFPVLIHAPEPGVRIAIVTCGAGASTGFAVGEELIDDLLH